MRLAAVAMLSLGLATPGLAAEAVTYKGTLGKYPILVELAASADGGLLGRYSYMANGGDIPLNADGRSSDTVMMAEEAPCTQTTCKRDESGGVTDIPVGAHWTLTPSGDGASLNGVWQSVGKSGEPGKTLDIRLARIGQRALADDADVTPAGLHDSAFDLSYPGEAGLNAEAAPYEVAKMEVNLKEGPEEDLEGSTFRYVTDPRSRFPFPRVVSLADGSPSDRVNRALARRHAEINSYAFDCLAQIYAGFGANEYSAGMGPGTLGDYDSETIVVSYLSPTVMSWVESGSTWCGGAHPNNHSDSYTVDVRTGEPLALAKIFRDWVATARATDDDDGSAIDQAAAIQSPDSYHWGAGQPLIDYVIAHRQPDDDATFEADCGIDERIASNLAVRFVLGGRALFTLEGLPHVVAACGGDLLSVKLADIPQLLAPTARAYFPFLAN